MAAVSVNLRCMKRSRLIKQIIVQVHMCLCIHKVRKCMASGGSEGEQNCLLKPLPEQLRVNCQLDPSTAGALKDTAEDRLGGHRTRMQTGWEGIIR